ncbi:MAG: cyclic nucleotide-binding domain-containing protein [Deltaproteobacteria bacterium]|nr:cyclic nucleotide-binding domain-containing protein [Deltaproteobacteria bacterium]
MSDPGKRDILRRVRAFADLSDADCDAVLGVLKARRGAPGDVLFREGDPGDSLMIVLEGQLVASVKTDRGDTEQVAALGPGEVVGEMSFIDAEPRSATVSTPGGATVLAFDRAALVTLARTAPKVAAAIQRNVLFDVARRLRDAGEKLTDEAAGGPPQSRLAEEATKRSSRGLTVDQLRSIPALAGYTREDLELLAFIAKLRTFATGEVLMREGTEGDACWLVVQGAVTVSRSQHIGAEALAQLGPGALVGQLALLDRAPRSATVVAARDTAALELRADAFVNLVRASSPIALRFQHQVALAGVRQLRLATRKLAASSARASSPPSMSTMRLLDDWDDGSDAGESSNLELAVDPVSLRRPLS